MLKQEINSTSAKLAGGAVTYAGSYTAVEKTLDVEKTIDVAYASDIAAMVAAILTAIYFIAQIGYTIWKWRQEIKKANKEDSQ